MPTTIRWTVSRSRMVSAPVQIDCLNDVVPHVRELSHHDPLRRRFALHNQDRLARAGSVRNWWQCAWRARTMFAGGWEIQPEHRAVAGLALHGDISTGLMGEPIHDLRPSPGRVARSLVV